MGTTFHATCRRLIVPMQTGAVHRFAGTVAGVSVVSLIPFVAEDGNQPAGAGGIRRLTEIVERVDSRPIRDDFDWQQWRGSSYASTDGRNHVVVYQPVALKFGKRPPTTNHPRAAAPAAPAVTPGAPTGSCESRFAR
jgi:hypothetical protein